MGEFCLSALRGRKFSPKGAAQAAGTAIGWWCGVKKRTAIRRVDGQALRRVLEACRGTAAEIILRLAWGAGLIPEEMHRLVWRDVDLEAGVIRLPDRSVPVDEETAACLRARYEQPFSGRSEFVLLSDRRRVHVNRVQIFRYAREALTEGGLEGVTLMTLRQDFILRQMEQHGRTYAVRVAGVTAAALDAAFGKSAEKPADRPERGTVDTTRLFEVLLEEQGSPEGLTLWLTWEHGLKSKEIVALTWEQVDWETGVITLEDRQVEMDGILMDWLGAERARRTPEDDPHVVLTPRSRRPYDGPHLSRAVKEVLIRAGMEQVTLRDLYIKGQCEKKDALLLRRAALQGHVTREDTMELFRVGWRPAWDLLHRLVQEGKLVRVGARYYPAGTAVPPERHFETVRAYLETEGGAYRKELAQLLRIEEKQCGWILSGLVAEGKLAREGQRYVLPEEAAHLLR